MNEYLLFAGDNYYPGGGIHDWQGAFESLDDALKQAEIEDWDWWHIVLKSDMSTCAANVTLRN